MIERGKEPNPKVLIVDDELQVLESLLDLMRKEFHVYATTDPSEAIATLEREEFAVILSDQRMPRVNGAELLARAAVIRPATPRILLTAYSDIEAIIKAINEGRLYYYVVKPWNADNLLALVRDAARHYSLTGENQQLIQGLSEQEGFGAAAGQKNSLLESEHQRLQKDNQILKETLENINNSFWHIKKMQEVLPICMECGDVRTDGGEWWPVLKFMKENLLFLSHGYCPPCAEQAFALMKRRKGQIKHDG